MVSVPIQAKFAATNFAIGTLSMVEIQNRGFMLVLSSPSGAGKTTLTAGLLAHDPSLTLSVSVTTRAPRPNEVEGKHYHFIDRRKFDDMVAANAFLEHATVFENSYGTPRAEIEAILAAGGIVVGDLDWQGTQQLQEKIRNDLVTVFILPPSVTELERRLTARNQDGPEVVRKRMAQALKEIEHFNEYDYVIINTDLNKSQKRLQAIVEAERARRVRQIGLASFVQEISGR